MFSINRYFARSSIVSAISTPIFCNIEDICLGSDFQKRQVYSDLRKTFVSLEKSARGDYLIIDFIDERFGTARLADSVLTMSNELLASNFLCDKSVQIQSKESVFAYVSGGEKNIGKRWSVRLKKMYRLSELWGRFGYLYLGDLCLIDCLEIFCRMICKAYPAKNIILHKAKMIDTYLDHSDKKQEFPRHVLLYNKKFNRVLDFMYGYVEKFFPNLIILDHSQLYDADERNKWGLASMHYQRTYYEDTLRILKKSLQDSRR